MKKVSLRAFSALLMAFLIVVGLFVYIGRYIKDGEMWALYFDQSTSGSTYTLTAQDEGKSIFVQGKSGCLVG